MKTSIWLHLLSPSGSLTTAGKWFNSTVRSSGDGKKPQPFSDYHILLTADGHCIQPLSEDLKCSFTMLSSERKHYIILGFNTIGFLHQHAFICGWCSKRSGLKTLKRLLKFWRSIDEVHFKVVWKMWEEGFSIYYMYQHFHNNFNLGLVKKSFHHLKPSSSTWL